MALEPVGCILLGSGVDFSVSQSQDRRVCVSQLRGIEVRWGRIQQQLLFQGKKGVGGMPGPGWGPGDHPHGPRSGLGGGLGGSGHPTGAVEGEAEPGGRQQQGQGGQRPVLGLSALSCRQLHLGGGRGKGKKGKKGIKRGRRHPQTPPSGDSPSPQPALSDPNARTAGIWGQKGGAFSSGVPPPQHPRRFWGAPNPSPAPVPPPPAGSRDTAPASSRPRGEGRGVPARRAPPQFLLAPYLEQAKIPRGEASGPDDHGVRGGSRIRPRGPSETGGERGAAVSSDQRPLLPQAHTAQRGGARRRFGGNRGGFGTGESRVLRGGSPRPAIGEGVAVGLGSGGEILVVGSGVVVGGGALVSGVVPGLSPRCMAGGGPGCVPLASSSSPPHLLISWPSENGDWGPPELGSPSFPAGRFDGRSGL